MRSHSGRFEGPENPADYEACREAALTLLDAAPRSSGALEERLMAKGYESAVVGRVMRWLVDVGFVDDEAYAQSMVRYCLSRRLGRVGTLRELMRRGVDRSLAERVVAWFEGTDAFVESAYELGRRVARKTEGMDVEKRRRRLWGAGGRKGHDPSVIRRVAEDLFGVGA
ncbi:regulatory protein RecX [Bifidobacterium pluvialisilvae]|uniref:regulatory protein RecX n=1 Tax=Bifidobacterium pluvialisilvae TaxID=2834436 RepID=UPI003557A269